MTKPTPWTDEQRVAVHAVLDLWVATEDPVDAVLDPIEAALADHAPADEPELVEVLVIGRSVERSRVLLSSVLRSLNEDDSVVAHRTQALAASVDVPNRLRGMAFDRIYIELGAPALVVDAARQHLARTGGVLVPLV